MIPDLTTFRSLFSELSDATDPEVLAHLSLATNWVDQRLWSENDYPLGVLYWAAHALQLKATLAASQTAGGTGSTDVYINRVSFGERSVQFAQRQSRSVKSSTIGPGEDLLNDTIYGQQYLQLRARNIIPVAIV